LKNTDLQYAETGYRFGIEVRSGSFTASVTPFTIGQDDRHPTEPFLETPNVLACQMLKVLGTGLIEVKWAGGILLIPDEGEPFSHFTVGRREIEIGLTPPQGPPINGFIGFVAKVETVDDAILIALEVNGATVRVEAPREKWRQLSLPLGQKVYRFIQLRALQVC
jgi:hypothetical protein